MLKIFKCKICNRVLLKKQKNNISFFGKGNINDGYFFIKCPNCKNTQKIEK